MFTKDELLYLVEIIGEEKEIEIATLKERLDNTLSAETLGVNASITLKIADMNGEEILYI